MFLYLSVVMAVMLLLFRNDIVRLIDVPTEAVGETRDYLTVCFIGIPFIMAYNIIASIFRGLGDSKSPMYFVAIACVANIALDCLGNSQPEHRGDASAKGTAHHVVCNDYYDQLWCGDGSQFAVYP